MSPRVGDYVVITSIKCNGERGVILSVDYPVCLILINNDTLGLLYFEQFEVCDV